MRVLLCFLVLSSFIYAIQEDLIEKSMKVYIEESINIAKKKDLDLSKKGQKIFEILDPVFDYSVMSRISLGKHWKKLTQNEQYEFAKVFEKTLKKSYLSKLELYDNQNIEIKDARKIKKNRIWLYSYIKAEKEDIEVVYKFYPNKKGDWLIYDVDIEGVSILKSYRAQFDDFLKGSDIDKLKSKLINNL